MIATATLNFAPVVVTVYARADHAKRTLDALAANPGAEKTDVFIYCDGAREAADRDAVLATREAVRTAAGFRSVSIVERDANIGLARNITSAVSEIVAAHGRVIVVEDDILTAPNFLQFMNQALETYQDTPEVWHIAGWNYPIDPTGLDDTFFVRVMNCWGWATWADRWDHFERDPSALIDTFTSAQRRAFNLEGAHNFFAQIESNAAGKNVTWAIFWYAAIFLRNGLCLNPTQSLVENIGFDGTGENCGAADIAQSTLRNGSKLTLPEDIQENPLALKRIQRNFRKALMRRIFSKLKRMAGVRRGTSS